MKSSRVIAEIYARLQAHFGPQQWWPADTPFEVMVGAILTQNTNWQNVEKAIAQLKTAQCLEAHAMYALPPAELAQLIRPAGYYNIKADRLRHFLQYFIERYEADAKRMCEAPTEQLRTELLAVKGIGPETADSILLYALEKPIFVIDAYTHRILSRHHVSAAETSYHELQELCTDSLPRETCDYNEAHALFVATGKEFCRPRNPRCDACPLRGCNWE